MFKLNLSNINWRRGLAPSHGRKRAIYLVIVFALFLFLQAEIYLRAHGYYPQSVLARCDSDPLYDWLKLTDHISVRGSVISKEDPNVLENTNPDTSRRSWSSEKKDYDSRILVVGCSQTFGMGVADEQTLVWLLNKRYPRTRFDNFGVKGYGTYQCLLTMQYWLEQRHYDGVIYFYIRDHGPRSAKLHLLPAPNQKYRLGPYAEFDLFGFLRSVKSTVIMAISIPFSVMITILVMVFSGITLNMITMTGLILGIGMVVDASVVVLENIYSYRIRGTSAKVSAEIGTQEVMSSVISGNLTTICVFIPFFVYKSKLDMLGELFTTLMVVIIIALLSSLVVAMFLVPVLAGKFLPVDNRTEVPINNKFLKKCDSAVENAIDFVRDRYRAALRVALHHRFATVLISFTILSSSVLLFNHLRVTFMSNFNDTEVGLNVELPLGTKLSETKSVLEQFYQIAKDEIKDYENIVVSVGSSSGMSLSTDTSYKGSISITLPDASKQTDSADSVKQKLRRHFEDFPTATFTFDDGKMQQMTGSDIDIALSGNSLEKLVETGNQIKDLIKEKIPEATEPSLDIEEGLPQVEIRIDRARASSFGISVSSIANEINYSINGKTATTYRADGDDYSVVVLLNDQDRGDIPDLEKIYVNGTNGRYAVSNFAQVVRRTGPVSISRENKTRTVHLTAEITAGSSAGEVENQIKQTINENMVIPEEVNVSFEGSWKDTMNTMKILLIVVFLAVILVFGVMAGTYESFKDPFINMFTLPFLIVGVVVIHLVTGQSFSMVSMLGVVMLVGIVVNNGIILVDQTNLLVRRGMKVLEACESAGASRLRPVLMTTLTTILGMIPMAFFGDANSSMTQPIGLCIIGGLTSSTIVTLFIIPVLYSLFNRKEDSQKKNEVAPELLAMLKENHKENSNHQ